MRSVVPVFFALTKTWLRSKTGVFFSFLFPVMLLLIFGTIFGGTQSAQLTLHIQNLDLDSEKPTELSRTLIDILESIGSFDIKRLDPTINVSTYIKENPTFTSYRVLIIPQGFEQRTLDKSMAVRIDVTIDTLSHLEETYGRYIGEDELSGMKEGRDFLSTWKGRVATPEQAEILLLTDEGDTSAPVVKGIVDSVVKAFNNKLIGGEDIINISSQSIREKKMEAADYYLPGYIAAFIMTNGIMGLATTLSEHRRNGTIKRLASTPLTKTSWIIANVLQQALLAFALTAVMIAVGWVIFDVRVLPGFFAILLIFLGAVAFCSVGIVLGNVIKDIEATSGVGNAIGFPMMFLSGAFWPLEMMPGYLQTIAKFLPLYYFHDGLRSIMVYQSPTLPTVSFLVLGIFSAVFILLAIKVTKWKEL